MKRLPQLLLNLLFPLKCPLCGTLTEGATARLCPACHEKMEEELALPCPHCGEPAASCYCIPTNLRGNSALIGGRSHICVGFYRPNHTGSPLSRLIYYLKHETDDSAARIFAERLSHALLRHFLASGEDIRSWTFTYPPRTRSAADTYGLDQAQRIARLCARRTGASFASLLRRRGGAEQKSLRGVERIDNAALSLQVHSPARCAGKKVILVDDIVTTGATAAVTSLLLRDAGTEAVFCASVLKTIPGSKEKNKADETPL